MNREQFKDGKMRDAYYSMVDKIYLLEVQIKESKDPELAKALGQMVEALDKIRKRLDSTYAWD